MDAYKISAQETLDALGVDAQAGLDDAQAEGSRREHGKNEFMPAKKESMFRRIWNSLREPMILMLVFAAFVTLTVNIIRACTGGKGDFIECIGIFGAIALSVAITVIMEGRSAKAFEALSKINEDVTVKALRNGKTVLIPQKEVVVGDVLIIATGDKLPADARLLESVSLTADESALTGESMPVSKDAAAVYAEGKTPVAERRNIVYSGSFITGGSGKAVVTAVGDRTEFGQIAGELSGTAHGSTPLQEKIGRLGKIIAIVGIAAAALVFVVQLILFFARGTAGFDSISEAFITSIVLIVAAVPEGLPTIVAVSLAVNIIKMSKENALVKKMIACETVGCINVICSDKTGTLTENKMTVTAVYDGGALRPENMTDGPLLKNFCINSAADVRFEPSGDVFIGNPTECALLTAAKKAGTDYAAVRKAADVRRVYPFSSETKNMTTVTRDGDGFTAFSKGSPEKILSLCAIPDADRQTVQTAIEGYQKKACRVIAFAHKTFSEEPCYGDRTSVERALSFDGFVAITDPLRKDVYEAVASCRKAGIEVKMLTGDNIVTACAIAGELGLTDDAHIAVEASALEELSDEAFCETLPRIGVIARSTPTVKMRAVKALKSLGNVVAVTGDGINDAPAIKNADVGIAMGISGTEVSKQASDIVLLDDSFSTIVKSVQWGRGIYENFQRFIQFQLTVNLSSVVVVLFSILCGFAAPFSALQLLWINIIMDGPPALTLGLEPIRGDLMKRRPTRRGASIVTGGMLTRILVSGIYISAVFMAQHFTNFLGVSAEQMSSALFTLFVLFQLFNAFNSRELNHGSIFRNFTSNRLMLGVFVLTFALQVVITQFGGAMFGTAPLSPLQWLCITALGFSVILVSELAKLVLRMFARKKGRAGA